MHIPLPGTHFLGQVVLLPQLLPVGSHVCWVIISRHRLAFGTHNVQLVPMHAPGAHKKSRPQLLPLGSQVCRVVVSLHRVVLGLHTKQAPATQEPRAQARSPPHAPLTSQVCCVVGLRHCVLPGTHDPAQSPVDIEQMYGHTARLCHVPDASHVCGVFPTHCLALGTHIPVQLPLVEQT
jgi:hypothetical protein